jgi:dipeptidyl aminopeptidase/acylaminoacyl peptidase
VTPYGEWRSPISAADLGAGSRRLGFPALVGDEIWWCEDRPHQGGRTTVMARRADGSLDELLPAPWGARSRVHEYGGVAYAALPGPAGTGLVFVNFDDQRIYRRDPSAGRPVPLTPPPPSYAALRYADLVLSPDRTEVWCVRERHRAGDLDRHVVAVPVDGSAVREPAAVREVVGGSRFLGCPRVSPDGTRLAWLAWDHPNMPWDGTELRVGTLDGGRVTEWSTVLGGPTESVFQPDWDGAGHLLAVSDRSGWWNLYRVPAPGTSGSLTPLCPRAEEFGAPLWQLGAATWGRLGDGRLLCVHGVDPQRLGVLDPGTGELTDLDLPFRAYTASLAVAGDRAAVIAAGPTTPNSVVAIDVPNSRGEVVRPAVDPASLPDPAWLPVPECLTLSTPDGRAVHANLYRPRNPEYAGEPGTRPPYVVFVHGGPTSYSAPVLDLTKAFFTSRGIGVLDVNYGGSTGYGRAYRDRLVGHWGVVDVEDAVAAAGALVAKGEADAGRLAIRGGSAGGLTVLCAVTGTTAFAGGASQFGIADLRRLAATTHDFESRYVETMVGKDLYARSPLSRAHRTRCPVLLQQGSDDPIVPREQAEQFRDALVAAGVPHALVVYRGEHHGFRRAATVTAAAEAELSFYGQVLGFDPPGIPTLPLS